jgi:hypothetical protein
MSLEDSSLTNYCQTSNQNGHVRTNIIQFGYNKRTTEHITPNDLEFFATAKADG